MVTLAFTCAFVILFLLYAMSFNPEQRKLIDEGKTEDLIKSLDVYQKHLNFFMFITLSGALLSAFFAIVTFIIGFGK